MRFDPTLGAEIQKTRPALIIQNDIGNRYSPITIVAAITSKFKEPLPPVKVRITAWEGGLTTDSVALLNHIRSIDRQRLIRRLGKLKQETIERVDRALMISLGVIKL